MADDFTQGQEPVQAAPTGDLPGGIAPQQVIPEVSAQKPKKKFNFMTLLFFLAIVAAAGYLLYQYVLAPTPEYEVDGKKFTMKSTPKDFLNAGLVICDKNGKVVDLTGSSVLGKSVLNAEYQIGIPDTDTHATQTGIYFKVMNTATNAKGIKDCMVYSVTYWPGSDKTGGRVRINGQDLTTLDAGDWVEAFKAAKFPFSDKELDEFKSGASTIVLGERGRYEYEAKTETSTKVPSFIRFTNTIKTEAKK